MTSQQSQPKPPKTARVIVNLSHDGRWLTSGTVLTIGPGGDLDEATALAWLAHGFIEPTPPAGDARTAERVAPRRTACRTGKQ